jgi:hypothetical protein
MPFFRSQDPKIIAQQCVMLSDRQGYMLRWTWIGLFKKSIIFMLCALKGDGHQKPGQALTKRERTFI